MSKQYNAGLMARVKERILKEPKELDMFEWFSPGGTFKEWLKYRSGEKSAWGCGTVACIAGWTIFLNDLTEFTMESPAKQATRYLGVTYEEASMIFLPGNWPPRVWDRYLMARNDGEWKKAAEITIKAIELWEKGLRQKGYEFTGLEEPQVEPAALELVELPKRRKTGSKIPDKVLVEAK